MGNREKFACSGVVCPECGSSRVARMLWGMPALSDYLRRSLEDGSVVLGGCYLPEPRPDWRCDDCGCEFGDDPGAYEGWRGWRTAELRSVVYGAAVGDALGVPFEFMDRGSFACTGMSGGGAHGMPRGTFSDDTSMLVATCDSIRACRVVDVDDMRERFRAWIDRGEYTADGVVFDFGNATATALRQGFGCAGERSNGNGSLMRIAPLALTPASDEQVREVSAITHAHSVSTGACVVFVHVLREVLSGVPLDEAVEDNVPGASAPFSLSDLVELRREGVRSGGYVVDTLRAALWCALHTESYHDCVLAAVNLGDDTDTTACVAGALAGAMYGFGSIPREWLDQLRGRDVIEACLF